MLKPEFGFKEKDINNVDHVIEALHELAAECAKVHEELEVETIRASVLRHRLKFLPGQIKEEITGAINSARQSNADELARLQQKLETINGNITFLEDRHRTLETENSKLHPERDRVRQEHEEIIMQLNQRMAEKAGKQIILNETRDKLRETNQKIVDIEDGIQQLKEDLILERSEMRMEKKQLRKAVHDTALKIREQKEANVEKKKEVDVLNEKLMDSEGKLENIRKSIRCYETSRARLEGQERALSAQLARQLKQNDEFRLKGESIASQISLKTTEFKANKARLEDEAQELEQDILKEKHRNKELVAEKEILALAVKDKLEVKRTDEARVKDANSRLQKAKQDLAVKAEEVGRLTQENVDMESRMEDMIDGNKAIVATLKKQIEESRINLERERSQRVERQGERDKAQKELDDFKAETNKLLAEMNFQIANGKRDHDDLSREGTSLQKSIRDNEETVKRLKSNVEVTNLDYEQQKASFEEEIKNLQEEVSSMKAKVKEMDTLLEEKTPVFSEYEKHFEEKTQEYDKMKKDIVAKKNQKMCLEDSMKHAKKELGKMKKPREELWQSLRRKRGQYLQQLHANADDVQCIENKILDFGCKLKIVIEENNRFHQANEQIIKELSNMEQCETHNAALVIDLEEHFNNLKTNLRKEWDADNQLSKDCAIKDSKIVDELGRLVDGTCERGQLIARISGCLEKELQVLADFLDNVAKRRPKDSHQEPRSDKPLEESEKLKILRSETRMSMKSPKQNQSKKPSHKTDSNSTKNKQSSQESD